MKRSLPAIGLIFLMIFAVIPLRAQVYDVDFQDAPEEAEEDAPAQRVARLSFVEGDVSFLRAGVTEWAEAVENLPLLAGDQVYAGNGARAEIQLGRGNYIRLFENSALTISELSDTAAQFEVTEGIAIVRVERLGSAFERFEVDTPNAAFLLKEDGLYRVNVRGSDHSEVIARRGSAEVSTLDGNLTLREGRRLIIDTSANGRIELALDDSADDWDRWSYERDTTIDSTTVAASPDYVNTYETTYNSFYGASDLSRYGTWTNVSDYGYCWVPRVSSGWAPYRYGQWLWIPATGWTWLSSEPWGWAPYHYGRWAFLSGLGWVWVPGFRSSYYQHHYSYYRWRPALVYFFDCPTPRGNYVAWYPLRPGERWRRADWHRRGSNHAHLQYPRVRDGWERPSSRRPGVSILPVEGFARPRRGGARPEAPGGDLSRWIDRSARPGLPQVNPGHAAFAPARGRSVATPPREVIARSVITRNRPSTPQLGESAPRVRKLIPPRVQGGGISMPLPVDGNSGNRTGRRASRSPEGQGDAQSGQQNGGSSLRQARPKTPTMTDTYIPVPSYRRADRDDDSGRSAENKNSGARRSGERARGNGDVSDSGGDGERNRPVFRPAPEVVGSPSDKFAGRKGNDENDSADNGRRGRKDNDNSGDASSRDRAREQRERRERKREEGMPGIGLPRSERHSEGSFRPRERDNPSPRVAEPRPERAPEYREHRREERRQQRQEQRQQRRNNR